MKKQTSADWQEPEKQREQDSERENALRELKTPLLERLIKSKDKNPAAATVLGQERRLEWLAQGDASKREEAEDLLHLAASQGEPEACFTLANLASEDNDWCTAEEQREFMRWATLCGHLITREWQDNAEDAQNEIERANHDLWLVDDEQIRRDNKNTIQLNRKPAELGDAIAQFRLGKAIYEKAVYEEVTNEPNHNVISEARYWVEQAALSLPEARHYLVTREWIGNKTSKLELLLSSAFPSEGKVYSKALFDLADEHIKMKDFARAEFCLSTSIDHNVPGAHYKLAMLLKSQYANDVEKLKQVRDLLLKDIEANLHSGLSAWDFDHKKESALQLGIMFTRGEGGEQSFTKAREMFELAKGKYISNRNTFICAELSLAFGWGNYNAWEWCVEQLVRKLAANSFNADAGIYLSWDDLLTLLARNPYFEKSLKIAEEANETNVEDYHLVHFLRLTEALFTILQSPQLLLSHLEPLLVTPKSMLEQYIWGQLWLTGRLGREDLSLAVRHFEKMIHIIRNLKRNSLTGPKHYRSIEFREWLFAEAMHMLKNAHTRLENEQRNRFEADIERTKSEAIENMMAMFAHKFRGAVDSIMFNTEHLHDERLYVDMAQTMNGLLDIFAIVSTSPERIADSFRSDVNGSGSPNKIFTHSIKLALMQLCSHRDRRRMSQYYLAHAKRQGQAPDNLTLKAWISEEAWQAVEASLQEQWNSDIGRLIVDGDINSVAIWMYEHLLPLELTGFTDNDIHFDPHGRKASMLTIVFTEIMVNAIKHGVPGSTQAISVSWREEGDSIVFASQNPSTKETRSRSRGSGRGHKFLSMLAEHMGGSLAVDVYQDVSQVRLRFPASLMKGTA